MLVVALTGGIGSGKSVVSTLFSAKGIHIIDADIIAKLLVQSPSIYFKKIIEHFGSHILSHQQEIDRKKLREIIIHDSKEKTWLEQLLHPAIRKQIQHEINQLHADYCIVVIPLLVETRTSNLYDRILVIDCEEETQINRVILRDHISEESIQCLLKQQASRKERLAIADDIILNDHSIIHLQQQVDQLHQKYLKIVSLKQ